MTIGTDVLIATQTFTGSDGTALPAPFATRRGNWAIYSNACGHQLGLGLGTNSCTANPTRANDNYSVTATANQDESNGSVKGIMLRRTNGTTTTNNCYLLGRDDSSHAIIWKVTNDVETVLIDAGYTAALNGTYTASVETVGGNAVLTLTTSTGTALASYTDSSSPLLSGDVGFYDNMNGATGLWDNVSMVGTASGTPGNATGAGATQNATAPTGTAAVTGVFPGYSNILRDTDTGTPLANATGLIMSYRTNSNDGTVAWSTTTGTTDATGKAIAKTGLAGSTGSMGTVGSSGYLTIENSAKTIVATYKITIVDLGS